MHVDVVDLRDFYETRLGNLARQTIRLRMRRIWSDVRGQSILGIGFASPYLQPFREEAERTLAFMPAPQGVVHWPDTGPGLTALVEETDLPLQDASINRVILAHSLEYSGYTKPLLEEVWRVLDGSGRLLIAVPNRTGIWARAEGTPFGHGYPYTARQISNLLRDASFVPETVAYALFMPPLRWKMAFAAASTWESAGNRWFERVGGVVIIEASKRIFQRVSDGDRKRVRKPLLVPVRGTSGQPVGIGLATRKCAFSRQSDD